MRNKEKDKIWREQNKERLALYNKEWAKNNQNNLAQYRLNNRDKLLETSKNWQSNNRQKANQAHIKYIKKRLENDPEFKFKHVLRSQIKKSFNRGNGIFYKKAKFEEILGCSFAEFREYILEKCPKGVTVKDFKSNGYHIDHIIPISSANSEEEVIKLCHYTNLQPLWWLDNIKKSNKP